MSVPPLPARLKVLIVEDDRTSRELLRLLLTATGYNVVATATVDRAAGFPRMTRSGNALLFAWTEVAATPAVRTAIVRLR